MWDQRGQHHFDVRKFNLGFRMAGNYSLYRMKYSNNLYDDESKTIMRDIELKPMFGINLGLITSFKLHSNFDLRFIPEVSLEQRNFTYLLDSVGVTEGGFGTETKKIEAAYLNLPILIKFKSHYYDVYRVYVQAGAQVSVNLASTKKVTNNPNLLKTKTTDISGSVAFGIDLYGDRLKLSPEIRYNFGLVDLYLPKNTRFAGAITKLVSQSIVIGLNFE